jgi:hypothetical protein
MLSSCRRHHRSLHALLGLRPHRALVDLRPSKKQWSRTVEDDVEFKGDNKVEILLSFLLEGERLPTILFPFYELIPAGGGSF